MLLTAFCFKTSNCGYNQRYKSGLNRVFLVQKTKNATAGLNVAKCYLERLRIRDIRISNLDMERD